MCSFSLPVCLSQTLYRKNNMESKNIHRIIFSFLIVITLITCVIGILRNNVAASSRIHHGSLLHWERVFSYQGKKGHRKLDYVKTGKKVLLPGDKVRIYGKENKYMYKIGKNRYLPIVAVDGVKRIIKRNTYYYNDKERPIKSCKLYKGQTVRTYVQMSFLGKKDHLYYETHYGWVRAKDIKK